MTEVERWIKKRLGQVAGLPSPIAAWRSLDETVEDVARRLAGEGGSAVDEFVDELVARGPILDPAHALTLIEAGGTALLEHLAALRDRTTDEQRSLLSDLSVGIGADLTVMAGLAAWHRACRAVRDRRFGDPARHHAEGMDALGRVTERVRDTPDPAPPASSIDGG